MKITKFTSESVMPGHPDKLADQISDAVLDSFLRSDPESRVACETYLSGNLVVVGGEVSSKGLVDMPAITKETIKTAGFTDRSMGIDPDDCVITTALHHQSPDIAQGVNRTFEERTGTLHDDLDMVGAGDMGTMYGYACNETPELMPFAISMAHKIIMHLSAVRMSDDLPYLRPDGKVQVTMVYENDRPKYVDTVVMAVQHDEGIDFEKTLKPDILRTVLKPVIPEGMVDYKKLKLFINTTGKFVTGGPAADTGLSGRKQAVDNYGGMSRHGGSSFSGKDPTKVDRTGAYGARYAAKNIVKAGLADRCEITVSYAIGIAHPVAITAETFGTEKIPVMKIVKTVFECFDLRPGALIKKFDLKRPIFLKTATFGHFGRDDPDFAWEQTDQAEPLRQMLGKAA